MALLNESSSRPSPCVVFSKEIVSLSLSPLFLSLQWWWFLLQKTKLLSISISIDCYYLFFRTPKLIIATYLLEVYKAQDFLRFVFRICPFLRLSKMMMTSKE